MWSNPTTPPCSRSPEAPEFFKPKQGMSAHEVQFGRIGVGGAIQSHKKRVKKKLGWIEEVEHVGVGGRSAEER